VGGGTDNGLCEAFVLRSRSLSQAAVAAREERLFQLGVLRRDERMKAFVRHSRHP
jgi:hypothetical protein